MSRGPDAATLLERALIRSGADHGISVEIAAGDWRRWASATFVGARHKITMRLSGDARCWLDGLPEADLPLRGHLVAGLSVECVRTGGDSTIAAIEVLSVEER
ncbi:hypothetical protein [Stakelama marina]|uniref:Uncharacterized protein n=1 Tax=Stakelama marina TaxID=2826939 RepID=A0A8T4IGV9_9SPHN|nr:hypothetical protein [Stakelama marina]MBR0553800.1 hypothetical protein [Stakelama marina]